MEEISDLERVLAHLDRGWNVFPISPNEKIPPKGFSWDQYQDTVRVTEEMVRAWFYEYPDCNWAIACGTISNLVVLDIDGPVGHQTLKKYHPEIFENENGTLVQKSPHGWHMFYQHPGHHVKSFNIATKVDIKADGGYILVSPSKIHDDRYVILRDSDLAPCPHWIAESIKPEEQQPSANGTEDPVKIQPMWVTDLLDKGSPAGRRNQDAARLVGYFHSKHLTRDIIFKIMTPWAQMCQPPFDNRELNQVIRSVTQYQQVAKQHGIADPPTMTPGGDGIKFAWAQYNIDIIVSKMSDSERYGMVARVDVRTNNIPGVPKYLYGPVDISLRSTQSLSGLVQQCADRMHGPPWKQIINDMSRLSVTEFSNGPKWIMLRDAPRAKFMGFAHKPLLLAKEPTLWFSAGGGMKSWMALALGVTLETGVDIGLGLPIQQQHVAYLDWEWDVDQHATRLDQIMPREQQRDYGMNMIYRDCGGRTLRQQVDQIKRMINDEGITYVIIDSASPACGRAADNDDIVTFFQAIKQLGVGSLILAHVTKSDRQHGEDVSMAYGGVQWENQARSTWNIRKAQSENSQISDIVLTHHKMNAGARQPPVAVRFEFPDAYDETGLVSIQMRSNEQEVFESATPNAALRQQIVFILGEGPLTLEEIGSGLAVQPDDALSSIILSMESRGILTRIISQDGMEYFALRKQ